MHRVAAYKYRTKANIKTIRRYFNPNNSKRDDASITSFHGKSQGCQRSKKGTGVYQMRAKVLKARVCETIV